jgi:hypothetical protein
MDQEALSKLQQSPGTFGSIPDPGATKYLSLLREVYQSYPGIEDARNFDLEVTDRAKFGSLHVRWKSGELSFHYDRFDMAVRPISHLAIDVIPDLPRAIRSMGAF